MTLLAKLMVLFNLAVSTMVAIWAMLLYTNGVDWSDTAPKAATAEASAVPAGKLYEPKQETDVLVANKGKAEATWKSVRPAVFRQVNEMKGDRVWYESELKHLRTGATDAKPAREVEYNDKHLPTSDLANFNRPKMVPVNWRADTPLQALTHYDAEALVKVRELLKERELLKAKLDEDVKLTNKIVGGGDDPGDDPKGLRVRLTDEKNRRLDVLGEERLVEPLETVSRVESELLLRRQEDLKQQLGQLEQYLRRHHKMAFKKDGR